MSEVFRLSSWIKKWWVFIPVAAVLLLVFASFLFFEKTGGRDFSWFFLGYIFLFKLTVLYSLSPPALALLASSLLLIFLSIFSLIDGHIPAIEFFSIVNPFIIALTLLLAPKWRGQVFLNMFLPQIFRVILLAAFMKYGISHLAGLNDRPFLFHENNFELPFFLILYLTIYRRIKFNLDIFLLVSIFGLSGSLSGAAILIFALLFDKRFLLLFVPIGLFLLLGGYQSVNVTVFDRISSLQDEERVIWIDDLFEARENEGKPISGLLFGRPGPLPPEFCETLKHANLPDLSRPDWCFSRVLHGNIPRLVVDFGLVPTFLFGISFFYFLAMHLGWRRSFMMTSIIFLNGLSVSGFGNEIAMSAVAVSICHACFQRNIERFT